MIAAILYILVVFLVLNLLYFINDTSFLELDKRNEKLFRSRYSEEHILQQQIAEYYNKKYNAFKLTQEKEMQMSEFEKMNRDIDSMEDLLNDTTESKIPPT